MGLIYQKERFIDLMSELPELFHEHWVMIAHHRDVIPLDPAWDKYLQMEKTGVLHILTARDNGRLVGYAFGFLYPHLHYKTTLYGHSDMFFLSKQSARGLAAGIRLYQMLRLFLKMMRDLGAKKVYINFKVDHDLSSICERLGMKFVEKVFHIVF